MLNFYGFVPVALGGMGSNRGAVVGGIALGLFQQTARCPGGRHFRLGRRVRRVHHRPAGAARGARRRSHGTARMMDTATSPPAIATDGRARQARGLDAGPGADRCRRCPCRCSAIPTWASSARARASTGCSCRASTWWSGLRGQIAIGWVALLTLGAYVTSVLTAGTAVPELSPYLALLIAAVFGAIFGVIVGLPALRLRTFYFAMTTLGLCDHRHAGGPGLEERHRRRRRRARAGLSLAVLDPVGILLFLPRPCGDLHLDDNQHRGEPLRTLTGGNPRCRGRSRGRRHLQAGPAGHGVPVQRGACRHRRRIVRVAAILHHARCLYVRPVGPVLHCHPDRRARVHSRAAARHDHPDRAARIRRAAGGLVDLPLCGAAAGDRARSCPAVSPRCWTSRTAGRWSSIDRYVRAPSCCSA